MQIEHQQFAFSGQNDTRWDRARLSIVVPIGVIVAVAIVCIVVAVLSSAKHADEVASNYEEQLFARSLVSNGQRILREVESVAASNAARQNIHEQYDRVWVQRRLGQWLTSFFKHDYVFVFTNSDTLSFSQFGKFDSETGWFETARSNLLPLVEHLRGNSSTFSDVNHASIILSDDSNTLAHAVTIQSFTGNPALVAAVAIKPVDSARTDDNAVTSVVIAIKIIDNDFLTSISSQVGLRNLRQLQKETLASSIHAYDLTAANGSVIARFGWTPRQPGSEIVDSVIPYIAIALTGFVLLAAFVLHYMRKTATAITAGENRMRHLAMHDPLSGLPNRMYFSARLDDVIKNVKQTGHPAAVLYIDLDHFKEVNDTLGHHVGDELIQIVTLRILKEIRPDDLVARLGGDEFAIISMSDPDTGATTALADRLISQICSPYSIDNQVIVIGASIGIAAIDPFCEAAADIMRFADMALYRAKNEGRSRACVYDMVMDADLTKRKILENDLRRAIERDTLRLEYQPFFNSSGSTIFGVEALCRWDHPTRGEISPLEFIPIAEHSGLIIALGEWVLRRACLDGLNWPDLTVAVNVSPLQFRRAEFVDSVERVLSETGLAPSRLELELTESTLIGNVDSANAAMRRLKAMGIKLALDDFGTGYSSLQYLRRFPFDKIKIDQSFVRSIEKSSDSAAIVHAIVSLGRGLGMKVTAEGVETADQQLFLRAAGVHSMQGFRFSKPVPADDITALITARQLPAPTPLAAANA